MYQPTAYQEQDLSVINKDSRKNFFASKPFESSQNFSRKVNFNKKYAYVKVYIAKGSNISLNANLHPANTGKKIDKQIMNDFKSEILNTVPEANREKFFVFL